METKNIIVEKHVPIAVITIAHPPANTFNLDTTRQFQQAIDEVENDKSVRVVVLTGAGDTFFSAGFDVSDAKNADTISPLARGLWTRIDRFPKLVVAALNGHAVGGGLELALSCHFRIMTDISEYRLGLTELNLGIIPGWGGTQRLSRIVGRARALNMILFSKTVSPREALDLGLVDRLAPSAKLMDEAREFAGSLAERPPIAVRWVLKAMAAGTYEGLEKGLDTEAEGSTAVRKTRDRDEGFAAFLEKRKPVFRGE